ncbi:MAG: hypothetical protein LBI14_08545 [Treponema sp.]|jgi:hypothetical protein|nr:hypothetical protein [Treponema sp.]
MKKALFCVIAVLALGMNLYAQEPTWAIGLGIEWNMNAREKYAGGAVLSFDYSFEQFFAAGFSITASSNFAGIIVIEPVIMFRLYFLESGYYGFFFQNEMGVYLVLENGLTPMFDIGIRAGFRLPLGQRFYLEPYGRLGYPFAYGLGVMAGVRF